MNQKKEFKQDYFGLFTKPLETIEKKSYKKLMVLGSSIGISFAIVVSICLLTIHYNKENNIKEEQQLLLQQETTKISNEKAQVLFINKKNELVSKIHMIDRKKFNSFIDFIKYQQQIYNSRFDLVSNIIINAKNSNDKAIDIKNVNTVNELKAQYEKPYYQAMTKFINMYENIQNQILINEIGINELMSLLTEYNKYQSSIYIPNYELDKKLEFYIYPINKANAEYNNKNNVMENYKKLKEESIMKINNYHSL